MTRYAIAVDCNRCVGCMACNGACKMVNNVPIGSFWNKVLRIGPNEPGQDEVPSHKLPDGTVQIDKDKCIGCQFCAMSCPYGVRYLNEEERVVEKCTLCEQQIAQGELPQCVTNCVGMAKWFGDLDEGIESFRGPCGKTMGDFCEPFDGEHDVHTLTDVGNRPSFLYILRDHTWRGKE